MENNQQSNQISGAITYPQRNEQQAPVQPRQPRNLQGLLRFAMEATKAEDAPGNSELGPMDEERRKFLEEALKSLTVDIAELLHKAIKVLTDSEKIKSIQFGSELPEDVEASFNSLMEFIDDIDISNDFYKVGGFAMFPICFSSENDQVRSRASRVLAELCQNNPFCQARALECGLVNVLLHMVGTERGETLASCISALSCACREFKPSCEEVIAQEGCETLANILSTAQGPARTKVAFFVTYLCQQHPPAREKFIKLNIVKILAEQIKSGRDSSSEHLLSIIHSLLESLDQTVVQQCLDPSLNLKNILENHLKDPEVQDAYIEEKNYCEVILKILEKCPQVEVVNSEADR
ncbi:unnamed protein product [Leptidea sinapis]|uniref:Nucleotide exchange factor Fes1 domain-containing protein n=2 Tax=Leptidea sinapis TaxID=189913 RepID=A0A5E4QL78_9NEOP|nr:unnamed protein product [Leptidea sinapis]